MSLPCGEKFKCQILSWGRVVRDAEELSRIIRASGYSPDIIVAIGRGGYVPARILCDCLLLCDLTSIKVEHWGVAALQKEKAVVKFPLCARIRDKKVLLVDDITDTGETLRVSLKYLKRFRPREVRTAVLIHKTCSSVVPDYFFRKIIKWRWVIFPWHLREDLTGFIERLKTEGVQHANDLRRKLKQRYGIDVPPDTIQDVLSFDSNVFATDIKIYRCSDNLMQDKFVP
jgi:hypoxanthine phosphoribosyltransferase